MENIWNEKRIEEVLDHLYTNVYITDVETDEIVYMNETMKHTFDIHDPEGKTCWRVLQSGMRRRCEFCKIKKLLEDSKQAVCVWNEENTATGKVYKNHDSLLEWEGRKYHIQHSIDITKQIEFSESVSRDELTGFLNRREGKERLQAYIDRGKQETCILTVVLYDINELKFVNDRYGHSAGDSLIFRVAESVRNQLGQEDFGLRLSGDEFLLVFYDKEQKEVDQYMKDALESLLKEKGEKKLPYHLSFSYGMTQVYPAEIRAVSEIIAKADERMYVQKRDFHIRRAKGSLLYAPRQTEKTSFKYDEKSLYDTLIESTDDYIFVGNMKTGTFRYSPSMAKEFGLPSPILDNAAAFWGALIHPDDEKMFMESNQEIADGRSDYHNIEYRAKNVTGEWIWLQCRGKMACDSQGNPELFAGFITNLGMRNKRDHMTGLYNRFEFEGRVKKYLVDAEHSKSLGVMVLNIDGFNNINDLYNRSFGDEILRVTAQKISGLLPSNAQVFRLDGDEFVVAVFNADEEAGCSIFADIQEMFSGQQEYAGKKYHCTMSAGYCAYPKDADNYLDLMKYANYSLETSKAAGKNRLTVYMPELLQEKTRRLGIMEKLRESIERGFIGFKVFFQPQVEADTGRLCGAEALARWQCSEYGNVSPGEFIPILEECGLIVLLGRWVFEQALNQCKKWLEIRPDFHMSINLSYHQLMEDDILSYMDEMLRKTGVKPSAITMELTETYLVKEDKVARGVMEGIRSMGMCTAMDDFGTGYSSLFSLKSSPVDIVKIDREFSRGITTDAFNITFIKAITELCQDAGKQVCLEGIETEQEYLIIKEQTTLEMIQGYYFGCPVSAQDFENNFMC